MGLIVDENNYVDKVGIIDYIGDSYAPKKYSVKRALAALEDPDLKNASTTSSLQIAITLLRGVEQGGVYLMLAYGLFLKMFLLCLTKSIILNFNRWKSEQVEIVFTAIAAILSTVLVVNWKEMKSKTRI